MALISCPNCGTDISEEAKKCPHCGKKLKRNKFIIPVIMVLILIIACVGIFFGWKQYQKVQEEKRQEKIENLLTQVDEAYAKFDFDGIEECYDTLDGLQYDTSKQREILEYDRLVYADAYAYYQAINDVDERLHNGDYSSLRALMNKMITPTKNFEALEINNDSKIGKYISNVRNNIMYTMFNSEFVNSTEYDLDYYLTSWGYVTILETYTEEIVKEEFPYVEQE